MLTQNESVIFASLGSCIADNKQEFVELLRESGVSASSTEDVQVLVDKYVENVGTNPALLIGSAFLCTYYATDIHFDGQKSVDNNAVHQIGRNLFSYFDMGNNLVDEETSHLDWGNVWSGVQKTAQGLQSQGWVGGIGAAVNEIGSGVDRKRNPQKYAPERRPMSTAGTDMLRRKQEARQQMIQAALAAQQAKAQAAAKIAEEERKKKKITYWAIGIGGVVLLGTAAFLIIRAQKKKGK